MTTFKQFILENTDTFGSESITEDEAIELLKTHCDQTLKGPKLYRGGPRVPIMFGDSNAGTPRKSANTSNYYTLFIDNSPEWKEFPKRSRSFIGSTAIGGAFTTMPWAKHYMIPFDDAKVGVCPNRDFWASFNQGQSPDLLNYYVSDLARAMKIRTNDESWEYTRDMLLSMTREVINEVWHSDDDYTEPVIELLDEYHADNFLELFENYFTPKDFDVWKASNMMDYSHTENKNREVFVQGKVVFVTILTDMPEVSKVEKFLKEEGYLSE